MKQATDVVIIGGGVIGCSIAYHLRRRGAEVTVVDQGAIGSGASCAATGLLAPIRPFLKSDAPYMILQLAGLRLFSSFAAELEDASGIAIEYERTGTLRAVDLSQKDRLIAWVKDWQRVGFNMEFLIDDELRRREPLLSSDIVAGIYNADEPQLNAVQLVAAYARAAANMGATFCTQTEVLGVSSQGNKITGLSTSQGDIPCGHLIIAAGAWSAFCGDWLGVKIPVRPLRGQSLALLPSFPLHHILFADHIYLAPKKDGTIIVGATQEEAGFQAVTTSEGIQSLMTAVEKVTPLLATSTIQRTWAGLRPRSSDTRPVLGGVPGWSNAFVASGGGGFGMLLSAITGQTMAELVTTGQTSPLIQPFSLERFPPHSNETTRTHAA